MDNPLQIVVTFWYNPILGQSCAITNPYVEMHSCLVVILSAAESFEGCIICNYCVVIVSTDLKTRG